MAQVRVRWGRILLLGLVLVSGVGYATYPSWQDKLKGTPLETAPTVLAQGFSQARSWLEAQWRQLTGQTLEAAHLLPGDTLVLITTQKLDQAIAVLGPLVSQQPSADVLTTLSQALSPDDPEQQALRKRMEDLETLGVDQNRPFSLALLPTQPADAPRTSVPGNSEPALGLIGLVPVTSDDALPALQNLLERQGQVVAQTEVAGRPALRLDSEMLALSWKRHLLFVWEAPQEAPSAGSSNPPLRAASESIAARLLARLEDPGTTLAETPTFSRLLSAHGPDWHILMWGAIGSSLAALVQPEEPQLASSLREIEGAAMAGVHLDNHRLRVRTAAMTRLSEMQGLLSKRANPDFLEQLRGRPVAVGTFAMNIEPALERMRQDPSTQEALQQLEKSLKERGISFQDDIIPSLEGTGGLAILPQQNSPQKGTLMDRLLSAAGKQVSQLAGMSWPAAGVFWLELKDPERIKTLLPLMSLESAQEGQQVERSEDESGQWVDAELFGMGISKDRLILTIGPGSLKQLRQVLQAGLPPKAERAWTLLDQDIQRALERREAGYFFLDIPQSIRLLEQHPIPRAMLISTKGAAMREMIESTLRGISSRTWMESEIWMSDYALLGPEAGLAAEAERFRRSAAQLLAQ